MENCPGAAQATLERANTTTANLKQMDGTREGQGGSPQAELYPQTAKRATRQRVCQILKYQITAPDIRGATLLPTRLQRLMGVRTRIHAAVSRIGAPEVITSVCSKCAQSERSRVRTVHPSLSVKTRPEPPAMIGSTVITRPSVKIWRASGSGKFGTRGSSWIVRPMPWPPSSRITE